MNPWNKIPLPYRIALLLAVVLAAIAFFFDKGRDYERNRCEVAAAGTEVAKTKKDAAIEVAGAQHDAAAARADTSALTNYVDQNLADQPPLRIVLSRIDAACVHDGTAEDRVSRSLPGVAGLAQEAGGEAEDGGRRTLVDDLKADIATCTDELNRLDACAARLRWQDGERQ